MSKKLMFVLAEAATIQARFAQTNVRTACAAIQNPSATTQVGMVT